jgi:hypothetical protein
MQVFWRKRNDKRQGSLMGDTPKNYVSYFRLNMAAASTMAQSFS